MEFDQLDCVSGWCPVCHLYDLLVHVAVRDVFGNSGCAIWHLPCVYQIVSDRSDHFEGYFSCPCSIQKAIQRQTEIADYNQKSIVVKLKSPSFGWALSLEKE